MAHTISYTLGVTLYENLAVNGNAIRVMNLILPYEEWHRAELTLTRVTDQHGNAITGFTYDGLTGIDYRGPGFDAEQVSTLYFHMSSSDNRDINPIEFTVVDRNDEAPLFGQVITPGPDTYIYESTVRAILNSPDRHHFTADQNLLNASVRFGTDDANQITYTLLQDSGAIEVTGPIAGLPSAWRGHYLVHAVRRGDTWSLQATDPNDGEATITADEKYFLFSLGQTAPVDQTPIFNLRGIVRETSADFRYEIAASSEPVWVDENGWVNSIIHQVSEAVADTSTAIVTYEMLNQYDSSYFAFNGETRIITLKTGLDHETKPQYRVTIKATATDGDYVQTATRDIFINVANLDDNGPRFASHSQQGLGTNAQGHATARVSSSYIGQNTLFTVSASDADGEAVTYSITRGNDAGLFTINSTTGAVSLAAGKTFDYDASTSHTLTINAQSVFPEAGSTAKNATQIVTVYLTPPVEISLSTASASLAEGTIGALASDLATVSTTSSSGYTFTTSDARFQVVGGKLQLAPGSVFNYENIPGHEVQVTITGTKDDALTISKDFTLTITDVNDLPPQIPHTVTSTADNFIYKSLTKIGSSDHHYFEADFDLFDGAGGSFRAGYAGTDPITFTLFLDYAQVAITGLFEGYDIPYAFNQNFYMWAVRVGEAWSLKAVLNSSEAPTSLASSASIDEAFFLYTVYLTGPNNGTVNSLSVSKVATGTTLNVAAPDALTVYLAENSPTSAAVYTLPEAVPDAAGTTVSYQMLAVGDHALFTFDSATRTLKARQGFDYETRTEYTVTLRAQTPHHDPDAAPLHTDLVLNVRITDIDDNGPVFIRHQDPNAPWVHVMSLTEGIDDHTQILYTAAAEDVEGQEIHYFIVGIGHNHDYFDIDSRTGAITLRENHILDYEDVKFFRINIGAVSGKGISVTDINNGIVSPDLVEGVDYFTSSKIETVQIHLIDANDNAPVFVNAKIYVDRSITRPITLTSLHLDVTDIDTGDVTFTYTLTSIPGGATLYRDGAALSQWDTFTQQDINDGMVKLKIKDFDTLTHFSLTVSDGVNASATKNFTIAIREEASLGNNQVRIEHHNKVDYSSLDKNLNIDTGDGNDKVTGSQGSDRVVAGKGDDIIILDHDTDNQDSGGRDNVVYQVVTGAVMVALDGGDQVVGFKRGEDVFELQTMTDDPAIQTLDGFLNYLKGLDKTSSHDDHMQVSPNFERVTDNNGNAVFNVAGITLHFEETSTYSDGRVSNGFTTITFDEAITWQTFLDLIRIKSTPDGAAGSSNQTAMEVNFDYGRNVIMDLSVLPALFGENSFIYTVLTPTPDPVTIPTTEVTGRNNVYRGTSADELIKASANNDIIASGGGDDIIIGGGGQDIITLSAGDETIIYHFDSDFSSRETSVAADGGDIIHNFSIGQDRLILTDGNSILGFDRLYDFDRHAEQLRTQFIIDDDDAMTGIKLIFGKAAPSASNTMTINFDAASWISSSTRQSWNGVNDAGTGLKTGFYLDQIFDDLIDIIPINQMDKELELV